MRSAFNSVIFLSSILVAAVPSVTNAEDIKPLDKNLAAKIVTSMGYRNVVVGAVVRGVGGMAIAEASGGDNSALVLAVGNREGKNQKIQMMLFHDSDLGWFWYQYQEGSNGEELVIWTEQGSKTIEPRPSAK